MDKKYDFARVWDTVFENEQKIVILKKRATIIFGMKIVIVSRSARFLVMIYFFSFGTKCKANLISTLRHVAEMQFLWLDL